MTLACLGVIVTLGVALGTAGPAAAHTKLVVADPVQDATLTSLEAVRLRFTDGLRPEFSSLVVTATEGGRVVSGAPSVTGTEISVPVTVTDTGSYAVAYRVLSADGHPVEGTYAVSFAPAPPATPPPSATPSASSSAEPTDVEGSGVGATDVATSGTAADEASGGGGMTLVGFGAGLLVCAALVGAGLVWRRCMRDHA